MSFDSKESSVHDGQPFECFRFTQGSKTWLYTSADRQISIPAGTFDPASIERTEQTFNAELSSGDIEVKLPRTDPVAASWRGYVPESRLSAFIYRGHRGDEILAISIFSGAVINCHFVGSQAILTLAPISHDLGRRFPRLRYQIMCNHALYSSECGINRAVFRQSITVTVIVLPTVFSNDFLAHPDGWYTGGYLERANGQRRYIENHTGNGVTLMNPFPDLASLEVVDAYPGCGLTERVDCETKFNNLLNHLGFARIPVDPPLDGRVRSSRSAWQT